MAWLRLDVLGGARPFAPVAHVFIYGNSITAGGAASIVGRTDYSSRVRDKLTLIDSLAGRTSDWSLSFLGHPGQSATDMLAGGAGSEANTDIPANYVAGKRNIFVFFEILNDINQGRTGIEAAANVATMCALAKSHGFDICIALTCFQTILFTSGQNAEIVIANNLVLSDTSGAIDLVSDSGSDPRLQDTDARYFSGVHPLDPGHAILADYLLPLVQLAYERAGGIQHTFSPLAVPDLVFSYIAEPNLLTKTGTDVSLWQDISGYARDVTASGTNRPLFNPSNPNFNGRPTLDSLINTNMVTPAFDLSITRAMEIIVVYSAVDADPIPLNNQFVAEFSTNVGEPGTFRCMHSRNSTGPEIDAFGEFGGNFSHAEGIGRPAAISFIFDFNLPAAEQTTLLQDGEPPPSLFSNNSVANTSLLGTHVLSLFARAPAILPLKGSIAAIFGYSRTLSISERADNETFISNRWATRP